MATMDSKYIQHLRKISAVLLRLKQNIKIISFWSCNGARYIILFCT